jgi:polysaccharide pyruvyl transferase WcaK-like protein
MGSGNRGCEGIIRGTAKIMNIPPAEATLCVSSKYDYDSDLTFGIDKLGNLFFVGNLTIIDSLAFIFLRVLRKLRINKEMADNYIATKFFVNAVHPAFVFITGGDLLCYEQSVAYLHKFFTEHIIKKRRIAFLYGCSVEKAVFQKESNLIEDLKQFKAIIARESLSFETLKNLGINNAYMYPDPAFVLLPEICELPEIFSKREVVGLNFSSYTNSYKMDLDTLFIRNIDILIKYIFENTKMYILLIPHVFWESEDDRKIIGKVYDKYQKNYRITVLDGEKLNYLQIRHVISKCKFFIGARTHSVISAYCTQVPTLALGYSVKSKGIAKDVGMPEYTVIDSKNLKSEKDILNAFIKLSENEEEIKRILENNIPYYIKSAYKAREVFERIELN